MLQPCVRSKQFCPRKLCALCTKAFGCPTSWVFKRPHLHNCSDEHGHMHMMSTSCLKNQKMLLTHPTPEKCFRLFWEFLATWYFSESNVGRRTNVALSYYLIIVYTHWIVNHFVRWITFLSYESLILRHKTHFWTHMWGLVGFFKLYEWSWRCTSSCTRCTSSCTNSTLLHKSTI